MVLVKSEALGPLLPSVFLVQLYPGPSGPSISYTLYRKNEIESEKGYMSHILYIRGKGLGPLGPLGPNGIFPGD